MRIPVRQCLLPRRGKRCIGKAPGWPSFPAYLIIAFESMILFGALGSFLGFLYHSHLPQGTVPPWAEKATQDRFAVFIPGAYPLGAQAQLLKELGASQIQHYAGAGS